MKNVVWFVIVFLLFCLVVRIAEGQVVDTVKVYNATGTQIGFVTKPKIAVDSALIRSQVKVDTALIVALKCPVAPVPVPIPVVTKERHAIYLDHFESRLATSDIQTIYSIAVADSFNTFYCYQPATAGTKVSYQATFNKYCHSKGWKVGAVHTSSFEDVVSFNRSQTDTTCRFDILVFESCCPEFWNEGANMVTHFISDSTNVVAANKLIGQYGISEVIFYAGHFKSPLQSRFPAMLVNQTSQIELHMYTTNYSSEYVAYRVDSLNNINVRQGTVKGYTEITSMEDVFFGPQLKLLGIHAIRAKRRALFAAHNYKGLKWQGDVVFDYEWYIKNRPAPVAVSAVRSTYPASGIKIPAELHVDPKHSNEIE